LHIIARGEFKPCFLAIFFYTGISRLGDGMALYKTKSTPPNYFSIVQHLRANRRVLVQLLAIRFTNNGFDKEGNLWNGTTIWKVIEEDIQEA
jgi:hypothetical protein